MIRKLKIIGLLIVGLGIIITATFIIQRRNTRKFSPAAVATFENKDLSVEIKYCRPYKKGRVIFGKASDGALQPFGEYWRLGANEATTIELNRDVMFGNQKLAKGTYSMYAIPGESSWIIGINSDAHHWGYAEPDHDKDVLQIKVPVTYKSEPLEQFKININQSDSGAFIQLNWDTSEITIPIK